ncbi:ATP-binding protein [Aliarcobacter butzleri]|uniref:sensor histidine kinase n=1 Tax=Aliarcobacter butzleri TaxID=28197 RepID=UPI001EDAA9E6|nr:ATP-binding protein [Aliarcobacter butzleri]MCG3663408.1 ATP-binding protein [Aliarcobacter butzleri]MCT7552877.1 ATP-binding protein [Aliarcobacter butzleri]
MITTEWKNVYFHSHVNIKNIIGKELINDDNVAVMELVKNSYDAGAKTVTVEFRNLKNESINNELFIVDDGNGMSQNDILHKWLNLAYSIKRVQNTQNNRLQAGNKGIGRFSCDRLGKNLDIYTKKDEKIYHLKINWEDFENQEDYSVEINQIPMKLREISLDEVFKETSYKIVSKGTIIKISHLRDKWMEFNNQSLFNEVLNYQKFISLKSSLEKLINKSQVESDNFKIFLKVSDIDDTKETSYNKKINGEIENKFFEKLDFDTTYIHSAISDDGKYIITKLKDRDNIIFKTIEKNIEFPNLKSVKIILMYLNPYGKVYFEKQMGVRGVDFGSVYLFINGFRIPPYGDTDNDSFGLEGRKGQGQRRYLGGRDIVGRIEIEDRSEQYSIISSREGVVQNESFLQLIHKSTKSTKSQIKNNGFFYKTLKRLEKYVVEGLKWDSVPKYMTEAKIKEQINSKIWNKNEIYVIDRSQKLTNISKNIFQIMNIDFNDIVDLTINENILKYLVEENPLNTQKNLTQFLKEFSKVPNHATDEKMKLFIKKIFKKTGDKVLLDKVSFILNKKLDEINILIDKNESYSQLDRKIKVLEIEHEDLKKELASVKLQKEKIEQEVTYLKLVTSKDVKELVAFQHHIGLYATTAKNFTLDSIDFLSAELDLNKDTLKKLQKVILELDKIKMISKYVTRENFLDAAKKVKTDIVEFIFNYIKSIYEVTTNKDLNIEINTNNIVHICKFEPIKISIILDNLLSNSKKEQIGAKHVQINFSKENNDLIMEYIDDGKGLDSSIIDENSIFEMGITTTTGSGLGLYHIKELLKEMKSDISVERQNQGIKFSIRFKI